MSLNMPSAPQQSSSSSVNAQQDVFLIDVVVEACAADPYFADDSTSAHLKIGGRETAL